MRFLKKVCSEGNLLPKENSKVGTSVLVRTFVSGILLILKQLCSEMKVVAEGKHESWKDRAGSDVRFWNLDVFFKNCNPNEMLSLRKIRKLEITGWERLSFLELCCFSKIVIGKHGSPMKNPQVGKNGLGATFVSGVLRLFNNCHPN